MAREHLLVVRWREWWNREKLRDIPICFRTEQNRTEQDTLLETLLLKQEWVRWIMSFWSNLQEWKEKTLIAL